MELTVSCQSEDAENMGEAIVDMLTCLCCHLLKHGAKKKDIHAVIDASERLVGGLEEHLYTDSGAMGGGDAAN
jgi:cytochrome c2